MEFTIGKMAELHGISRQTLIYYDKIGLFRPTRVDDSGARYYDSSQLPFLREICFLKEQNVPLKEIRKNMESRNRDSAMLLLKSQIEEIQIQQDALERTRQALLSRLSFYQKADCDLLQGDSLLVEHLEKRRAVFVKWPQEDMTVDLLHMCYVRGWEKLRQAGLNMDKGFGAVMRRSSLEADQPLNRAGSLFFIPENAPPVDGEIVIPEGDYLCMFRCGMPYKLNPVYEFWSLIARRQIKTSGDLISVCLLDTTFHSEHLKEDLCQLQIMLA